ncbi:putative caspase [Ophiocordyceps camponoti-floridani]|uniref:Putative caspase n=1 Tax=Ophiocordyceps camponoti-floridani TaxID=2030778 RepID=A0A8H4Q9L0_9HYPO|nr:putative caspase [Ophiocordyceps camponoti-floridani]
MSYVNIFQLAQTCRGRFEFQLTQFDRVTDVELLQTHQQRFIRWTRMLNVFEENNGIDYGLRKDPALHDLVMRSLDILHVKLQQLSGLPQAHHLTAVQKILAGLNSLGSVIRVSIDQRVAISNLYDWGMTVQGRNTIMVNQKLQIVNAMQGNNDRLFPRAIETIPLVCPIPTLLNPYIRICMSAAVRQLVFQDFKLARVCDDSQEGAFYLIVNEDRELEVQNRQMGRIVSLPTMRPFVGNLRYSRLVQHVVAYRYLEDLQGPLDVPYLLSFLACFVPWGANAGKLRVSNKGGTPLYLTVVNFTPQWEVVVLKKLDVSINKELSVVLESKVSPELRARGVTKCNDIVKAFVTRKPLRNLPDVILPPISLKEDCEIGAIGNGFYHWLNDLKGQLASHPWWCGRYEVPASADGRLDGITT